MAQFNRPIPQGLNDLDLKRKSKILKNLEMPASVDPAMPEFLPFLKE